MRLHLEQLRDEPRHFEFAPRPEGFAVLRQMAAEGAAAFIAPIRVRVAATLSGAVVRVEGRLETEVRLECGRCLETFAAPLTADFSLAFLPEPEALPPGDAERETPAEEIGVVYFRGEEIDLTEAVQEQIVLALPFRPLCRESCRGICAGCGADLNRESCRCPAARAEGAFAALGRLPKKRG